MKDESKIKVSIITPCFNEGKYIGQCLDSITAQDYPKDKLEVLVIDGKSTDRTREIVEKYIKEYPFIKLLDNPERIQTFATNIGIRNAKGNVIIRMDAHAGYPSDYISKSIYWLKKSEADCVGGLWITNPGKNTLIANTIAFALSNRFGVGNSYFRIGSKEPKYVDTVPFGCYRKEVFDRVGLFDENLNRTDDIEFNLRLKRAGGRVLLVPEIKSYYYARSGLKSLAQQNFGNGFWVIYSLRFVKLPFSIRHLIPFVFVITLLGSALLTLIFKPFVYLLILAGGSYLIANIFFSLQVSFKKGLKYFPALVLTFFTLHFSYGIGSLSGLMKYAFGKRGNGCFQ